jgi:Flp pilus assembly protein CpaB
MQTTLKPPKGSKDRGGPLSTRKGSIAAAAIAAAISGLVIVFFLQQYRQNVDKGGVPTPVLVAKQLIEQGASGDSVGAKSLFETTNVPRDQLKDGAVTDPAALRGRVAAIDILPGQQLTAKDFKAEGRGIVTKLASDQRAMTVSLDMAHGLIGKVGRGDHVDVLSGFIVDSEAGRNHPVLRMLMQDVLVLDVPKKEGGGAVGGGANETSEVTLRVPTGAAPRLAFAADNGKVWLALRPQNGSELDRTTLVTLESMLADADPVKLPAGRRAR